MPQAYQIASGSYINGAYFFNEYVGASDPQDIFTFQVSVPLRLNMTLSGMSSDADLELIQDINNNGQIDEREILASSRLGGTSQEFISKYLSAGKYFVRVAAYSESTYYRLNLSTVFLGNPDYIDTDPIYAQSYFGTNVNRSFFNSYGAATYQSQYGNFLMYGAISNYYTDNYYYNPNAKNGLFGIYAGLGLPTTPIYIQADGAEVMEFEGGTLTNRNGVVTPYYYQKNGDRFDLVGQGAPDGAELLWKNDYAYWNPGSVGQPIGPVNRINGGWEQRFTGSPRGDGDSVFLLKDGQIVQGGWDSNKIPLGGPYRVQGEFLNIYRSVGYTDVSKLGFPTMSQERANYNGFSSYQAFENGFIAQTYGDNRYIVQVLGKTIWTSTSLDVNQSVSGQLSSTDVRDAGDSYYGNSYSDSYRLTNLVAGQQYKATLTSTTGFLPALSLFTGQNSLSAISTTIINGNTAEIEFVADAYDYRLNATSTQSGAVGNYNLALAPVTAPPVNSYGKTFDLGVLPVYQSLVDATNNGSVDYKFQLTTNTDIGILVSGLSSDVSVSLLRTNAIDNVTLFERSDKPGNSDESINTNLEAGNYILRISGNSTSFNLALSSKVAGQIPTPTSAVVQGYNISELVYAVFQQYQGTLGNPTSGLINYSGTINYQLFNNGSIVSSQYGTFPLFGGIRQKYLSTGGLDGWLGVPTSAETGLGNGIIVQTFNGGYIQWNGSQAITYRNDGNVVSPTIVTSPNTGSGGGGVASGDNTIEIYPIVPNSSYRPLVIIDSVGNSSNGSSVIMPGGTIVVSGKANTSNMVFYLGGRAVQGNLTYLNDSSFTATLNVPSDIATGNYQIKVLAQSQQGLTQGYYSNYSVNIYAIPSLPPVITDVSSYSLDQKIGSVLNYAGAKLPTALTKDINEKLEQYVQELMLGLIVQLGITAIPIASQAQWSFFVVSTFSYSEKLLNLYNKLGDFNKVAEIIINCIDIVKITSSNSLSNADLEKAGDLLATTLSLIGSELLLVVFDFLTAGIVGDDIVRGLKASKEFANAFSKVIVSFDPIKIKQQLEAEGLDALTIENITGSTLDTLAEFLNITGKVAY